MCKLAKKVFEITKSENFRAGMSTTVSVELNKNGEGTAIVKWKHGMKRAVQVKRGQSLFIDMWGGFPAVAVWDAPEPPKDEVRRFLWKNGFPRKRVWKWDDPRFRSGEGEENDGAQSFAFVMARRTVKAQVLKTEWESSTDGRTYPGRKTIVGVAVLPGASLRQVKADFEKLMERYNDII